MKNEIHAISLNFRCSKSYLNLNDKVTVYLDIINNLDVALENINIQTIFDEKCLKIYENLFNCNDNKSSIIKIEKLDPLEHTRVECSLELYDIPKELKTVVFSKISYNTEIDGEFISEEIDTNPINLKIYNVKIEDFKISSNKEFYIAGEIIKYTITVSNIGNVVAQNVIIKDFVPKNTEFLDESIEFLGDSELFYLDNGLLIRKINEGSTITINFDAKINPNIKEESIKNKAVLEYKDYSKSTVEDKTKIIESNVHEVFISSGSVFSKDGLFTHKVNKEIFYLNDTVTHKVVIKNENKINIKSAYFKDEKNDSLEYVKNTLTINGIPKNAESIYEGVTLNNINSEDIVITYKTKAIGIPKEGKLNLNSKIYYILDSEYGIDKELNDKCEENSFYVYGALIKQENFKRHQDKELISIGEFIDCKIEIENSGNLDARNVILKENIIDEMSLVEGSFFINSEEIGKINLKEEICIGCIKPDNKVIIKYKLKANNFTKKDSELDSLLKYQCLLLNGNVTRHEINSNSLKIKIEGANLFLNKKVDKTLCKVNDILTFNVNLKNKGNLEALDIKIKDEKNENLEFIENTLYLNDKLLENENIYNGIWKDILEINEEINFSYKTKVTSLPKSNFTFSKTNLSYIHLIDDKEIPKNGFAESNNIKIVVVNPNILIKDINSISENKKVVKYSIDNNEIPFKILIKNDGNMLIEEVYFLEAIPFDLDFVKGSLMINNKSLDDNYFYNGFKIKNLDSQEYREINFLLKPKSNEDLKENLKVKSNIKYKFINSLNNELEEENIIFEENIFIIKPNLNVTKEVNKNLLVEGEDLTETLVLSNLGNFEIEDVEVILPSYDNLIPRENTLSIDNFIIENFPFDNKVLVGKLAQNEIKKISLRYGVINFNLENINLKPSKVIGKVKIKDSNILNNINILSNSLDISPIKNSILLEQSLSNKTVLAGDSVRYFLTIKNIGNTLCKDSTLNINVPEGLVYKENTLAIKNSLRYDILDLNEIFLGDIRVNEIIKVSLSFNIDKDVETNLLKINSKVSGECGLQNKYSDFKEFKSDCLSLKVEKCLVNIYRSCDKISANVGDRILINSIISNEGSLDLKDVVFYEEENSYLNFVEDSLKINNKPISLNKGLYDGINIGEIKKGKSITVECEFEYINGGFSGIIESFSSIDFSSINPSSSNFERFSVKSNILNIEKAISVFKTVNINGEIELNSSDPNILEVSNLIINPSILSYYPIQTIKNTSYDNQILTGKKMIIEGIIEEKIEYIIDDEFSALYFIEKTTPFSTFIVMPEGNEYDNVVFECKIEDTYFKATNSRKIFRDINFMIEGY